METGEPIALEVRLRRADGEYLSFLARAQPLRDAEGRILKWYGTSTEIDASRKQALVARDAAESYSQILDRVSAMLFTTTSEGELEFVNAPLLRYFGTGLEALQAWKTAAHLHPEDLPCTIELWSQAVTTRVPCIIEHRMRRHDGVYRTYSGADCEPHGLGLELLCVLPLRQLAFFHLDSPYLRSYQLLAVREIEAGSPEGSN